MAKRIGGFVAQYERMRRAWELVRADGDNFIEKEDQCIAFFMHCWHLKDHIRHDESLDQEVRTRLVKTVHVESPALKTCQELADGLKHLKRTPNEVRGFKESDNPPDMVGNLGVTIFPSARRGTDGHAAYYPMVSFKDSEQKQDEKALDMARQAVIAWERILTDEDSRSGALTAVGWRPAGAPS